MSDLQPTLFPFVASSPAPSSMRVFARTRVEGFHFWKDAPPEVEFLRVRHRHLFGVEVEVEVAHDDRDVEFIIMKREIERYFAEHPIDGPESCELIAVRLRDHLAASRGWRVRRITIDEDGENGAVLTWEE